MNRKIKTQRAARNGRMLKMSPQIPKIQEIKRKIYLGTYAGRQDWRLISQDEIFRISIFRAKNGLGKALLKYLGMVIILRHNISLIENDAQIFNSAFHKVLQHIQIHSHLGHAQFYQVQDLHKLFNSCSLIYNPLLVVGDLKKPWGNQLDTQLNLDTVLKLAAVYCVIFSIQIQTQFGHHQAFVFIVRISAK